MQRKKVQALKHLMYKGTKVEAQQYVQTDIDKFIRRKA